MPHTGNGDPYAAMTYGPRGLASHPGTVLCHECYSQPKIRERVRSSGKRAGLPRRFLTPRQLPSGSACVECSTNRKSPLRLLAAA